MVLLQETTLEYSLHYYHREATLYLTGPLGDANNIMFDLVSAHGYGD